MATDATIRYLKEEYKGAASVSYTLETSRSLTAARRTPVADARALPNDGLAQLRRRGFVLVRAPASPGLALVEVRAAPSDRSGSEGNGVRGNSSEAQLRWGADRPASRAHACRTRRSTGPPRSARWRRAARRGGRGRRTSRRARRW